MLYLHRLLSIPPHPVLSLPSFAFTLPASCFSGILLYVFCHSSSKVWSPFNNFVWNRSNSKIVSLLCLLYSTPSFTSGLFITTSSKLCSSQGSTFISDSCRFNFAPLLLVNVYKMTGYTLMLSLHVLKGYIQFSGLQQVYCTYLLVLWHLPPSESKWHNIVLNASGTLNIATFQIKLYTYTH